MHISRMAALTFLHTSTRHVERFANLLTEIAPHIAARHVVNEALLTWAMEDGDISPGLGEVVEREVMSLAPVSRVILCTCSTLGQAAELLDRKYEARVIRVDRPLARKAIHMGTRLAVVASVESTLAPTAELLEEEAQRAGVSPALTLSFVEGAWECFTAGDQEGYLRLVGEHAARVAVYADVVVLAQASMQGAEEFAPTHVPVLASPAAGIRYAVELMADAQAQKTSGGR